MFVNVAGGVLKRALRIAINAASEDRTHDLRIMRPTRYQLRYRRFCFYGGAAVLTKQASGVPATRICARLWPRNEARLGDGHQQAAPVGSCARTL